MVASTNTNNIGFSCQISQKFIYLPLLICAALVLPFAMVDTASACQVNVITEIERVLDGHKELKNVLRYLKLSENEILKALTQNETGTDKSYTFFAPTNWAFISMLPQDIFDPFFKDAELRETVLLHHFVRDSLTKDDLLKTTELIMADQKPSKLNRINPNEEAVKINGANIVLTPILLGSNLGVVYVVDKVFTTHDEINKAIDRHPVSETPWGPISPNSGQNVESQTVVVDLIAELLREEAAGKK